MTNWQVVTILIAGALVGAGMRLLERPKAREYVCQFQSSTDVICHDHDGTLFRLFKRAPGEFTVRLPEEAK